MVHLHQEDQNVSKILSSDKNQPTAATPAEITAFPGVNISLPQTTAYPQTPGQSISIQILPYTISPVTTISSGSYTITTNSTTNPFPTETFQGVWYEVEDFAPGDLAEISTEWVHPKKFFDKSNNPHKHVLACVGKKITKRASSEEIKSAIETERSKYYVGINKIGHFSHVFRGDTLTRNTLKNLFSSLDLPEKEVSELVNLVYRSTTPVWLTTYQRWFNLTTQEFLSVPTFLPYSDILVPLK